MNNDALHILPRVKWPQLQELFKRNGNKGTIGYSILKNWNKVISGEQDHKVFCPFGDVRNGMVAFTEMNAIIVHCPNDDLGNMETALRKTKQVDWTLPSLTVNMAQPHVTEMIRRIADDFDKKMVIIHANRYELNVNTARFDISLPEGLTFKPVTQDYLDLIVSKWAHKNMNKGAHTFFKRLIEAKSAYGLFREENLLSWVFISDIGLFFHLYTLEEYRRKGYADIVVKFLSNMLKDEQEIVSCFVVKDNERSAKLFAKLGFEVKEAYNFCELKNK